MVRRSAVGYVGSCRARNRVEKGSLSGVARYDGDPVSMVEGEVSVYEDEKVGDCG